MSTDNITERKLQELLQVLELPDSAYEKAITRYKDLGGWFDRPESTIRGLDPHIFVQGSFAFGTAIKPINESEEYDLDLACKVTKGISRTSHSQKALKDLVGAELELYRKARGIDAKPEPKHRCWRLKYKDELSFHMDVVPCIPADQVRKAEVSKLLLEAGAEGNLAQEVAEAAVWITDDRDPRFALVPSEWTPSNPEGYTAWFRSRMIRQNLYLLEKAQIDEVPLYRRKTALQRSVQLLKRHRDQMFRDNPDSKPISIIITTIAGNAAEAGEPLVETLQRILAALDAFRRSGSDKVLNPVNRNENFADKWSRPDYAHLKLKANFHAWVQQACADFKRLTENDSPQLLVEVAKSGFGARVSAETFSKATGQTATTVDTSFAKSSVAIVSAPKPWRA